QRGVLAKNVGGGIEIERVFVTHSLRDLRHHPPVRPCITGQRQERTLTRDAALGIGDRAALLAPRGGGKKNVSAAVHGVVRSDVLRNNEELKLPQGVAYRA